tara:strand:- start:3783 stop:3968 length:186 start_codon:yes stop_codon:yes gene_type:complete
MSQNENDQDSSIEEIIKKLDNNRSWILRELDKGLPAEIRMDLASLERDLSKLILRIKDKTE